MVKCELCGFEGKALNLHLKYKHNYTPKMYLEKFPDAKLYDEETKQKMKDNSAVKKATGKTMEERLGKEKADAAKAKIAKAARERLTGIPRTEEYKAKMRDTWDKKRDEWSQQIQDAWTDERRAKASKKQSEIIAEKGYHLARGKETSLEKFVRETLENNFGLTVIKQKPLLCGESYRYFDMYVPEWNLLIEADGEYWHTDSIRIQTDELKTISAKQQGFNFLRISDKDFRRKKTDECLKLLLTLFNSPETWDEHSMAVLNSRSNNIRT